MSKELIITMIQGAMMQLQSTALAVPEDKLNWKPLDNGRTVLDLLGDAAQTPIMVVELLKSPDNFNPYELFPKLTAEREGWTREQCLEKLQSNTAAAIEAIRATPDADLEKSITLPFGTRSVTLPLGAWMMIANRTFVSRFAQINYIQTLYGDFEGH